MKKLYLFILFFIVIIVGFFVFKNNINHFFYSPQNSNSNKIIKSNADVQIVAENLKIPWEIAFLPNNTMLVTERPGTLLILGKKKTAINIPDVEHVGEGGLLGLAIHPKFFNNHWIYLYYTLKTSQGLINRVVRYQLIKSQLKNEKIIIDNIPGAKYHDGGRIEFGPDGKLYITTGDATHRKKAQDLNYLGGKILRLNDDGSTPKDNPFKGSPIYCYGIRNSQGLAWDNQERLWATDHGRSAIFSGYDELNLIKPGKNYGWPTIQGSETKAGMVAPIIQSGPDVTWAPAGAAYYNGSIFFAGLRGQSLYKYNIKTGELKKHFFKKFGRLRAVVLHNGFIYISTSNRGSRGKAQQGDDKIIKISPDFLK